MKNKFTIPFIVSIFGIFSTILSYVTLSRFTGGSLDSCNWMENVSGDKYLSEISMPGSHNSAALYSLADLTGKCQDQPIDIQLTNGIRYLDIRLKVVANSLKTCHGIVDERQDFISLTRKCEMFLDSHKNETIVMCIKEEIDADTPTKFNDLLNEQLNRFEIIYKENRIPKLNEVRGKIVILSRFRNSTCGINLYDNWREPDQNRCTFDIERDGYKFHIQDNYCLDDINYKISEFDECLNYANTNLGNSPYILNFASGYLNGTFPMTYSVTAARIMNKEIPNLVKKYNFVGTVIMDFASEELCKAIYGRNFQ